jgi:hypothetical protein
MSEPSKEPGVVLPPDAQADFEAVKDKPVVYGAPLVRLFPDKMQRPGGVVKPGGKTPDKPGVEKTPYQTKG